MTVISQALEGLFDEMLEVEPRYNIAPTQRILAARQSDAGTREIVALKWGLIPSWAKEPKIASSMINARGETVADKPAFRAAFKSRRCLIPTDGFYEWEKKGNAKQPLHITIGNDDVFALAGLWEHWRDPQGAEVETCTIVTTTANSLMESFHDRMPVIVAPENYAKWLDTKATRETLESLIVPFSPDTMHVRPVSSFVNNARHEGPECLASA